MSICDLCDGQQGKSSRSKPHDQLVKVGEARLYRGVQPRGFEEQDYQCQCCAAKFTQSSNKNDLAWTLWQG